MGFPTKNDHFGVFWGYPHFLETPILVSPGFRFTINGRPIPSQKTHLDPPWPRAVHRYGPIPPQSPWHFDQVTTRGVSRSMFFFCLKKDLKTQEVF